MTCALLTQAECHGAELPPAVRPTTSSSSRGCCERLLHAFCAAFVKARKLQRAAQRAVEHGPRPGAFQGASFCQGLACCRAPGAEVTTGCPRGANAKTRSAPHGKPESGALWTVGTSLRTLCSPASLNCRFRVRRLHGRGAPALLAAAHDSLRRRGALARGRDLPCGTRRRRRNGG